MGSSAYVRPGRQLSLGIIDDPACYADNAALEMRTWGNSVNHHSLRGSRKFGRLAGLVAAGFVAAPGAYAHHGFGNFAMDEDIELSGVVTKIDFVNPHSWVHFDVT